MKSEPETAKVLNNFFSNTVKNLIILEYENLNSNIENIKDRVFKAISKNNNNLSLQIKERFYFHEVSNEKLEKEIRRLNEYKASQKSTFILQLSNVDIFAVFSCKKGNCAINTSNSPNIFKSADITSLHQKYRKNKKGNYRLVRKI